MKQDIKIKVKSQLKLESKMKHYGYILIMSETKFKLIGMRKKIH